MPDGGTYVATAVRIRTHWWKIDWPIVLTPEVMHVLVIQRQAEPALRTFNIFNECRPSPTLGEYCARNDVETCLFIISTQFCFLFFDTLPTRTSPLYVKTLQAKMRLGFVENLGWQRDS